MLDKMLGDEKPHGEYFCRYGLRICHLVHPHMRGEYSFLCYLLNQN